MRVERVGLAPTPSGLPVLSGDFDDGEPRGVQRAGKASPIGAGALHANTDDIAVRVEERDDLRVAATVGAELTIRDRSADVIEDRDIMRSSCAYRRPRPARTLATAGWWAAGRVSCSSLTGRFRSHRHRHVEAPEEPL